MVNEGYYNGKYKKLSEEDKQIIKLRAQNYTYKEIANQLNITPKRVDNRLAYIKRKVRQLMKEEENSNK